MKAGARPAAVAGVDGASPGTADPRMGSRLPHSETTAERKGRGRRSCACEDRAPRPDGKIAYGCEVRIRRGDTMRVLVTVKAYPGLGRTEGETVCVAGVRLDAPVPSWVRLWPVGFRELPGSAKFHKWQIIDIDASPSTRDDRPESFRPDLDSLQVGDRVDTNKNWAKRRELLGPLLGGTTLCELMRAQDEPGAPSLGLVKVRGGATATVIDGPVWDPSKELLAEIAASPHLFRDKALAPLRPPAYQVRYRWHCEDDGCNGHEHSSCDWEVGAAALSWRSRYDDVRPHLLKKFGEEMLAPDRDTYFFVGNQHQRPKTFMVLGSYYPKMEALA